MALVGQTSSQRPQKIQRPRNNDHVRSPVTGSVLMVNALAGQAMVQAAQTIH